MQRVIFIDIGDNDGKIKVSHIMRKSAPDAAACTGEQSEAFRIAVISINHRFHPSQSCQLTLVYVELRYSAMRQVMSWQLHLVD